ncbi:MAG: lasso peptide isopeptide bond-forming cyclase [Rhizonema sp. PD37]|nr:lasso peptide isopeptide bond-forming cyclase [Rhizonema sp. PD37]
MSGIMGIYYLNDRPVDREDLGIMVETLTHRGPDGADIWIDRAIGFGHRMLWTTPESLLEKLPFTGSTGNLTITSDARIDNRDELINTLKLNNCAAEKITDSQLILAAYEKWQESCPENLLGDFAFAIWDKQQQSVFCARDHLGVKPFYYFYQPSQTFLFASEIKALLCLQQVPRQLNEVRIADYLTFTMEDRAITSYQDILRLPPAHSMVISQSGIKIKSYWELDPHREMKMDSDQAYADKFREIFTEAVRCRLRSAFPIASQLSGGLDSSAVTCVARDLLTKKKKSLHTISTIFDTITECDERPFINAVLEQGGLTPHYVYGDEVGPLSHLDSIFRYEDEALLGPSHFYPWIVNRALKELGLRISLDGFDGDTTVCHGASRLTELARQGNWKTCIQEVQAFSPHFNISPNAAFRNYGLPYLKDFAKKFRWRAFFEGVRLIHKHFGVSRKQLIINHGIKPVLEQVQQLLQRKQRKVTNSFVSQTPLVKGNFAELIGLDERIQKFGALSTEPLTAKEQHWRGLTQGVLPYTLERVDQYAAMFSLEARHPFMDKRLIEFCLALPSDQKLYQGWGRMVMRRALEGILPTKVQWRGGKADLSANFDDGLLNRDRQILNEVMSHQIKYLEKYIDLDFLQTAYQRLISTGNEVRDEDITPIWVAVTLALWFDYKQVTP